MNMLIMEYHKSNVKTNCRRGTQRVCNDTTNEIAVGNCDCLTP